MRIVNKVTEKTYIQWIKEFVSKVISLSGLSCEEIIIEDIEYGKRIFLIIDGIDYDIRTWDFVPTDKDANNEICSEIVRYTLFKTVCDGDGGSHSEEVYSGSIKISWEN